MDQDQKALTPSQTAAMEILMSGADVFLTGKAGTGKSFVLNLFLDECKKQGRETVAMAPTGTAALNLKNGSTMHRTLGIKNGVLDPCESRPARLRSKVLETADVVVVDEVSMCRLDLFDRFMAMVRNARKKGGARQVVVVGDFYQLPPVAGKGDVEALRQLYPGTDSWFPFAGNEWGSAGFTTCVLEDVVRQEQPELVENLNLAREGDPACIPYFNRRVVESPDEVPEDVIWLTSTNARADDVNGRRADELVGEGHPERFYSALVAGDVKPSDMVVPKRVRLVVGARVMLVANLLEERLGNGSMGTVLEVKRDSVLVDFDSKAAPIEVGPKTWDIKKTIVKASVRPDGSTANVLEQQSVGSYTQVPLKLAFAVTIHKSQGKTFDSCAVDTNAFAAGMLYVGLSRCTSYEGLYLFPPIKRRNLFADPAVAELYSTAERPPVPAPVETRLAPEPAAGAVVERKALGEQGTVFLEVPACIAERVRGYIDALLEDRPN